MEYDFVLTEFWPLKGHSKYFANTHRLLSQKYNVLAIVTQDFNKAEDVNNLIRLRQDYYTPHSNVFFNIIFFYLHAFSIFSSIIKIVKEKKVDKVICLTYEVISLFLLTPFLSKKLTVYIMSHSNIDDYDRSPIRKWMFNKIKNRYHHIVLCGFMAEYLKSEYHISNPIVWPHPLNEIRERKGIRDIDCVGISYSNDEDIIGYLYNLEINTQVFKRYDIKIILKSKNISFDDSYLKIFKGRIPDEEYDELIDRAKCIFMPFPSSFKIRMSGTLVDSLTNDKALLATPTPVVMKCKEKYNDVVFVFSKDTFVEDLLKIKEGNINNDDFIRFKDFHNDLNLSELMYKTLEKSMAGEDVINIYDF